MKFAEFRLEFLQNNLNVEHLPLLILGQIVATCTRFFRVKLKNLGNLMLQEIGQIRCLYMPQCISVLETYYAEYLFNICLNASQYFAGRKEVLAWRAWEEGEQTGARPSCHQLQCKYKTQTTV